MFGINHELWKRQESGNPIRIAAIGAGAMGKYSIAQAELSPGMTVDVVVDINMETAVRALTNAGIPKNKIITTDSLSKAGMAIEKGNKVCTTNHEIAWKLGNIEVLLEVTGLPFYYAEYCYNAVMHGKHVVTLCVEGDVCVGSIIKEMADKVGVCYTGIYGDEPGVMNMLFSEATSLGFEVIAVTRSDMGGGDLKWNKETILEPLRAAGSDYMLGQNPAMYASFCDGSKTNEECCMVANATGLQPDVRGMHGPVVSHESFEEYCNKVPQLLRPKKDGGILNSTGVVERIAQPGAPVAWPGGRTPEVWESVVVRVTNECHRDFMKGPDGDYRLFYVPYHYPPIQGIISVAYAAIHGIPTIAPLPDKRYAEILAVAKKDLEPGEIIDEIGGFCLSGRIEKARIQRKENLVPLALCSKGKMKRKVKRGDALSYDDIELKEGIIHQLRKIQDSTFESV